MPAPSWRAGFDIGGTFTDVVLVDDSSGALHLHKLLTTPDDPARAALGGLAEICATNGIGLADVGVLVHGTTLVTNAIIEGRGATTALITTRGFRDLLEMGVEQRYDIYDLALRFPDPLVPRDMRFEITERCDADGSIATPLAEDELTALVARLRAAGVDSVAICLLHAWANPGHEQRLRALLEQHLPGVPVSLSSEVVPEVREYDRLVTTCANARVQPMMAGYLQRLERGLAQAGFAGQFWLTHSAGGLASLATARQFPIRFLESGPAGGALLAALIGREAGEGDILAFDMGGTTAKGCIVENGQPRIAREIEAARVHRLTPGSGLPIRAPVVDMIEIGGGGGSIARIDEVGLLQVGPRSAGAMPGPACYDQGGTQATVTDANLVMGLYDPAYFLGGRMRLDPERAEQAVAALGPGLGIGRDAVADGIHTLVNEAMAGALRAHAIEQGRDPRRLTMVAFGGAGPTHAAQVARRLGISRVIVPPASGAASALGFLAAPLSFEMARSHPAPLTGDWDRAATAQALQALAGQVRERLADAGVPAGQIVTHLSVEMRLCGQMHEISVGLPDPAQGTVPEAGLDPDALMAAFRTAYKARYGFLREGLPAEIVALHARATGPEPLPVLPEIAPSDRRPAATRKADRTILIDGARHLAAVHDRYALRPGDVIAGPAIVEEREATTLVLPGDSLTVDGRGNLCIALRAARPAVAAVAPARTGTTRDGAAARLKADPVGLEVMWSRLAAISEEMWTTVARTAHSLIVSEAKDFACELLDAQGETLAHCRRGMPVFNLTLPMAVKALLHHFPPETLHPGDVLVTNDPWLCAGHLPDVAVVTPLFRGGRLVALTGTVGHVSDIGGTKDSLAARELYDEGFQIPPMKLIEAGSVNETLTRLLEQNVRSGDQVLGDLFSFVGANDVGARRLAAFMDEYGLDDVAPLAEVVQDLAEGAMRRAIAALPNGVYRGESRFNPLGTPLRLGVQITIAGDGMEIAFPEPPPAFERGGLNCTLSYTQAHATYPLKCLLTPQVRGNAGCYRPFRVDAPEGSALNAPKPASVNVRTRTGWYIGPAIHAALADALPDAVQAPSGLPMSVTLFGATPAGPFSDVFMLGGGQGASAAGDGRGGLIFPSSAANTSIEMFELRTPVRVVEKVFLPDSGGAGRHRGGVAQRLSLRKRHDDGRPVHVTLFPEGVGIAAAGHFGGGAGRPARAWVADDAGALLRDCGTGALVTLDHPDQVLIADLTGGSGHGDPAERAPEALARDLRAGLVTPGAARRNHGPASAADPDHPQREHETHEF